MFKLKQKALASNLFRSKKESYGSSVCVPFKADLLIDSPYFNESSKSQQAKLLKRRYVPNEVEEEQVTRKEHVCFQNNQFG